MVSSIIPKTNQNNLTWGIIVVKSNLTDLTNFVTIVTIWFRRKSITEKIRPKIVLWAQRANDVFLFTKVKFGFSEKATKFDKIFVILLTRASCFVCATAYLSKSRQRFLKTNVDKLYYTNFKNDDWEAWLLEIFSYLNDS